MSIFPRPPWSTKDDSEEAPGETDDTFNGEHLFGSGHSGGHNSRLDRKEQRANSWTSIGSFARSANKTAWSLRGLSRDGFINSASSSGTSSIFGDSAQGLYVDHMKPENIGFAFRLRAESDTPASGMITTRSQQENAKHLQGLNNIFSSMDSSAMHKVHSMEKRCSTGAPVPFWRREVPFHESQPFVQGLAEALAFSGIASFIYVLAWLALAPSCNNTNFMAFNNITHTVNAFTYTGVSTWMYLSCSKVDRKYCEEVTCRADLVRIHLCSLGFWLDFISIGGLIAELVDYSQDKLSRRYSTSQLLMILQSLKAWRGCLDDRTRLTESSRGGFMAGLLQLFFRLIICAHCYGCVLIILANYETNHLHMQSWIAASSRSEGDCLTLYTESFYFAVIGLTTVGYGDLLVTSIEFAWNSFFLIASQLFVAKVCADLTWLTSMYNQHEAQIHEVRRETLVALQRMQVPSVLKRRVLAFQNYVNVMHNDNLDQSTLRGLSSNLIRELRLISYRGLVIQAPFLRHQPTDVISLIVNALFDSVYLPSDFIVRAGERGRELFFVKRGEVSAYCGPSSPVWGRSEEVATLHAGNYFGELSMLTGHPRGSFVMAKTYTICSILPFRAVEDLIEQHPEAFTSLVRNMTKMYSLKPKRSWLEASEMICDRYGFQSALEVFEWFMTFKDPSERIPDVTARAFDKALKSQGIGDMDCRIYWAELDSDGNGGISFDELARHLPNDWHLARRSSRHISANAAQHAVAQAAARLSREQFPLSVRRPSVPFFPGQPPTSPSGLTLDTMTPGVYDAVSGSFIPLSTLSPGTSTPTQSPGANNAAGHTGGGGDVVSEGDDVASGSGDSAVVRLQSIDTRRPSDPPPVAVVLSDTPVAVDVAASGPVAVDVAASGGIPATGPIETKLEALMEMNSSVLKEVENLKREISHSRSSWRHRHSS